MPIDIEVAELSAAGLAEPKAAWTMDAKQHLTEALRAELAARNATLVSYEPPVDEPQKAYRHTQLMKLHAAVLGTIMRHERDPNSKLPTKEGKFDWGLGPGANTLKEEYRADYAMFVAVRDVYSSKERTLLSVFLSLLYLFPVLPGSGLQVMASLVDLRTGDIVWLNLLARTTGGVRSAEPARETAKELLVKLPL